MHLDGLGVKQDYPHAVSLMQRAAALGNIAAMAYREWLADFMAAGGNYRGAEYWYHKAAELNIPGAREELAAVKDKIRLPRV